MSTTRREWLAKVSAASALALLAKNGGANAMSDRQVQPPAAPPLQKPGDLAPAYRGVHAVVPLPFDPTKLRGISEKMIVSHHDNNYAGALKNLNKVENALAQTTKETPPFVVAGLCERQLTFANSVALHELYFANLGGDGKAAGEIAKALNDAYGSFARWEEEFRATGMSLAGGSGWVILGLDLPTKAVRTWWSGNHTQSRASSIPLLVMDMYEHAFQIDYGAAAAKYVDAFFDNLQWEEVERRFARAQKAADALHA